jgi:hypothetical protein
MTQMITKTPSNAPRTWEEIDIGHCVLAQEDDEDTWYIARVIGVADDILQWRDYREEGDFEHQRTAVALLYPI